MQTLLVKFLANYISCLHCYIIFWTCRAFSHFTFYISLEVLYYIIDYVLTSYIKYCYVYVNFKWTNQSCLSSEISQSINVEWRTRYANGKQFFQWKEERLFSFDTARNVLIKTKIEILKAVKNSLLDFT